MTKPQIRRLTALLNSEVADYVLGGLVASAYTPEEEVFFVIEPRCRGDREAASTFWTRAGLTRRRSLRLLCEAAVS